MKTLNLKSIALAAAIGTSALLSTGCSPQKSAVPESYEINQIPVDQVFRDHNRYRIYYSDTNNEIKEVNIGSYIQWFSGNYYNIPTYPLIKETNEFKGLEIGARKIRIFKDLETGQRGFAKILSWNIEDGKYYYTEIHLPKDKGLSPGNVTFGGKYKAHQPLEEIK